MSDAQRVKMLIAKAIGIPVQSIHDSQHLIDDLGFDSLCKIELMIALEEEFGIPQVPDSDYPLINTVEQTVNYLISKRTVQ